MEGILHFIETGFIDFLEERNIKEVEHIPTEFYDAKYNFYFANDAISKIIIEYKPDANIISLDQII